MWVCLISSPSKLLMADTYKPYTVYVLLKTFALPHVDALRQADPYLNEPVSKTDTVCKLSAGGNKERDNAYDEAVAAIYENGSACHRHMRCYTSRKTGERKWTVLEMWPIADPLDGKLAVMVSEYNMTQQKELELQLSAQHLSLQRSTLCKLRLPCHQLACTCTQLRKLHKQWQKNARQYNQILVEICCLMCAFDCGCVGPQAEC